MIRQRILYVGIGGSGLDLGIKLDEALRREICGLDGRALIKSGAFPHLRPNQLPSFVQSLYIDLAAESLLHVTKNISGGNTVAASNLIPTIDSYTALATDLRLHSAVDFPWIPPSNGEPNIRPLNGGAGQYPTVGRAALFSSIKDQGYRNAIGGDITTVINSLAESMGDLSTYTGQNSVSDVAVYLGFSMSGGTGTGMFLDVLQLLIHEFHNQLSAVGVTILPVVLMPSTFDGLLDSVKARRAKLNAARALIDLSATVEQLAKQSAQYSANFKFKYPDPTLGNSGVVGIEFIAKAPHVPVVTVVEKPTIMDRNDVARSVAASIVAQTSTLRGIVSAGSAAAGTPPINKNSFHEHLINSIDDIQTQHRLGLGTHPLMPMVSVSLTLPSRKIADIVAKQIIADGLTEIQRELNAQPSQSSNWVEVMGHLRLDDLTKPETFDSDTNLKFVSKTAPKSISELEEQLAKLRGQISSAMPVIESLISQRISQRSVFNVADGLKRYLIASGLNSETDLPTAIITMGRALGQLETKRAAVGEITNAKRGKAQKKFAFFPKKLAPAVIKSAFEEARKKFELEVESKWWTRWASQSASWSNSVDVGKSTLIEMQHLLETLRDDFSKQVVSDQAELGQERVGIINFVPTGGRIMADALKQLTITTATQIRRNRQIENEAPSALLRALASRDNYNAWAEMVERYKNKMTHTQIYDALIEPVRQAIEEAMAGTEAVPGTLSSLGQLLVDSASDGASAQGVALKSKLGDLMPDGLIPHGEFLSARVLISYPGTQNTDVEELIKSSLSLGGDYKSLLSKKNVLAEFTATGDSDVLTVSVNLVGQGLLDNRETREILIRWREAFSSPIDDKLKWRQRVSYQNIDQIFTGRTKAALLNAMIRALFGGILEITKGSEESPESLLLKSKEGQVADLARVEIEVSGLPGFSSWPWVLEAFENMILGIDTQTDFRGQIVEQMFVYTPPILSAKNAETPSVVKTFLSLRASELQKLKDSKTANLFGEVAQQQINNAIVFWEEGVVSALEFETPLSTYRSLAIAMSAREPNFLWR